MILVSVVKPREQGQEDGVIMRKLMVVFAVLAVVFSAQILLADVAPDISVTPLDYDFGYGPIGSCLPAHFTLANNGNATLSVLDVVSSDPAVFEVSFSTPATVASGATADVLIAFCPAAATDYTGTVTFVSNDPDGNFVVNVSGTAIPPDISVTPESYDFGYGPVGSCHPADFVVSNLGHGDLVVSDVVSSDPSIFEVSVSTPATIGSGATVGLVIAFCPAAATDYAGTVTFVSNDPDGNFVVNVSGTAKKSLVSFEPADATEGYDFGKVQVCHTVEWSFVMKNATSATADFDYSFATSLPFAVLPTSGTLGIGSEATVTVTFHPTAVGATDGTLVLSSSNPEFTGDVVFDLSGYGVAPDIDTDTEVEFPDTPVRGHSDYSLEIANVATSATTGIVLTITNISSGATDFTIVGPTSATIATGETKTFTIRFAPSTVGTISGVVTVYSDDPDTPQWNIDVWGVGIKSPQVHFPNLEVSTDFGTLRVGEVTTGTLEIANTGDANLEIGNIAITDNNESFSLEFATKGTMTPAGIATQWTIEPGNALYVDISFHPVAIGATTGTLTIESNDPADPVYDVTLSGVGEAAPNVSVNPTSLDFGEVWVGHSTMNSFTVSNTSDLALLNLTGITSDNPAYTVTTNVPLPVTISTVTPVTVMVSFTPSTMGTISGIVTVSTDDPETPEVNVSLSGIGIADMIPPGRIDTLQAQTGTFGSGVILSWQAPADDGYDATSGTCASYDIRYSETGPINTIAQFDAATKLDTSEIIPATPGMIQAFEFQMPEQSTEYWFAMTSIDHRGNVSLLSNTVSAVSLAVELSWFKASAGDGRVVLTWETASEMDNLGFKLLRSTSLNASRFAQLNHGLIPGAGTTAEPQFYSYTDENVVNGVTYYYCLVAIDYSGVEQRSNLVAATPFEGNSAISVDVLANKSHFVAGDELALSIEASNSGETAMIDARMWATLPNGRTFSLLSANSVFFDGGMSVLADFVNYKFTKDDAVGEYIITCMITDSNTGNIVSYGVTSIRLTNMASVLPPSVWQFVGHGNGAAVGVQTKPDQMIAH